MRYFLVEWTNWRHGYRSLPVTAEDKATAEAVIKAAYPRYRKGSIKVKELVVKPAENTS